MSVESVTELPRLHPTMLVIVTLVPSGRKVSPEVEGSDLVEALRTQIDVLATPIVGKGTAAPGLQLVKFGEVVLEDGHTLAEYAIAKEAELMCVLRMKQIPIRLDVGGWCCSATLDTLQAVSGSLLHAMFEPMRQGEAPVEVRAAAAGAPSEGVPYEEAEPLAQAADGAFLIDRDGLSFRYVLNYLRARRPVYKNGLVVQREPEPEPEAESGAETGFSDVVLPESKPELRLLLAEVRYYRLPELEAWAQEQLRRIELRDDAIRPLVLALEGERLALEGERQMAANEFDAAVVTFTKARQMEITSKEITARSRSKFDTREALERAQKACGSMGDYKNREAELQKVRTRVLCPWRCAYVSARHMSVLY